LTALKITQKNHSVTNEHMSSGQSNVNCTCAVSFKLWRYSGLAEVTLLELMPRGV